ncbi:hypothetical protein [Desulforamulus aeronauticus]|uniref:Pentapeptide MXKDX repeat protein n=1 Tax=Desulforamulus aeronauticus DSM 10349 TaxID=1121421 RepID=A0A1M6X556_9FIRM|nr:hypothetical protein [Desulforamulus aeronauticus]SHL01044.1 hypothetical protein SAMN02745123_03902 [Desulforamulus aeronauticus DSM 10349]
MKKVYLLGAVSLLALSLLLAGCGNTDKSATTQDKQQTEQSQDMNNMNGDMKDMDHSNMNMDGQKSENK